jgi:hypothetical protein
MIGAAALAFVVAIGLMLIRALKGPTLYEPRSCCCLA